MGILFCSNLSAAILQTVTAVLATASCTIWRGGGMGINLFEIVFMWHRNKV